MDLRIHFLEALGSLETWKKQLYDCTTFVKQRIVDVVPFHCQNISVDIVFQYLLQNVLSDYGMGGEALRPGLVTISLDPANSSFTTKLQNGEMVRILAHELHHAMRYQQCGYGATLGEAVVSEGLADYFAEYVSGLPPARWSCSLNDADWEKFLPSLKEDWNKADYNHAAWFYGQGDYPLWAGYFAGYKLLQAYKKFCKQTYNGWGDLPYDVFTKILEEIIF